LVYCTAPSVGSPPGPGRASIGALYVVPLTDPAPAEADRPVVGELTAGLGVDRGLVQNDLDVGGRGGGRARLAVNNDSRDAGLGDLLVIPDESGGADLTEQLLVDASIGVARALRQRIGPGAFALLAHELAERILIHVQALLGGHLQGEVDGESVGVVQREGVCSRQRGRAGLLQP